MVISWAWKQEIYSKLVELLSLLGFFSQEQELIQVQSNFNKMSNLFLIQIHLWLWKICPTGPNSDTIQQERSHPSLSSWTEIYTNLTDSASVAGAYWAFSRSHQESSLMKQLEASEISEDFPPCSVLLQIHALSSQFCLVDSINDTEHFSEYKLGFKSEVKPVA